MKNILISIFIFKCFLCNAQKITVDESPEKFNSGTRNAINTTIYENYVADVIIEWEKYLNKNKCERITNDKGEVYGHNVFLKEIVNKPIDVYCKFEEDTINKKIKMSTALDIGASNYLKSESNPAEVKLLEKMVREFAVKMTKAPIIAYLKAANDFQKKLNDEIKIFEKDRKKLEENIVDYKNKITKTEKNIIIKNAELEKKKLEVTAHNKLMATKTDALSEKAKADKKAFNKIIKQQKDIEQVIAAHENEINKNLVKIQNFESSIKAKDESKIKNIKEIESQKLIAENWQNKLSLIS